MSLQRHLPPGAYARCSCYRWLIRRRARKPLFLSAKISLVGDAAITEAKLRRYQDEIDMWQQKHKVISDLLRYIVSSH